MTLVLVFGVRRSVCCTLVPVLGTVTPFLYPRSGFGGQGTSLETILLRTGKTTSDQLKSTPSPFWAACLDRDRRADLDQTQEELERAQEEAESLRKQVLVAIDDASQGWSKHDHSHFYAGMLQEWPPGDTFLCLHWRTRSSFWWRKMCRFFLGNFDKICHQISTTFFTPQIQNSITENFWGRFGVNFSYRVLHLMSHPIFGFSLCSAV